MMKIFTSSEMLTQPRHVMLVSRSNVLTILTVRHVACSLLYCSEPEQPTEGVIRKQILVGNTVATLSESSNISG